MKNLIYKNNPAFLNYQKKEQIENINNFTKNYITFLDNSKTERLAVDFIEKELESNGFKKINLFEKNKKLPSKIYFKFRNKNIAAINLNNNTLENGCNFLISHIDSPRIDLKQNPLIELSNNLMLKTHYYGGIKKYQWLNIPLALIGVVITKNNKKIDISFGLEEDSPILLIPDLAPHLSHKSQDKKKISEAVTGESLNVLAASTYSPEDKKEKEKLKLNILKFLNKKYGIIEEDLLTAELELVPAYKAKISGLDESFIAGYGHDDRVCAYTSLQAVITSQKTKKPAISIFYDKEEIGSDGATGAKSKFIEDIILTLSENLTNNSENYAIRKCFVNSNIISADVNTVINPNFPEVHETQNSSQIGCGIILTKFTGSGGKYSANDANAEFVSKIVQQFNKDKICWQIGELGKVDEGGGGTIAKFVAQYCSNVVDCGVGVMSMHSPYEIISKFDLYSAYEAYKSFLKL